MKFHGLIVIAPTLLVAGLMAYFYLDVINALGWIAITLAGVVHGICAGVILHRCGLKVWTLRTLIPIWKGLATALLLFCVSPGSFSTMEWIGVTAQCCFLAVAFGILFKGEPNVASDSKVLTEIK